MSSKRYISNNSSWAFPIVTIPQTSDGTTTLSVNYSGKSFSASTYTYNLPKLNMSLSVGRGYDVGTILLNGVDTNQTSISNYDVTEDLTISFTPAVARELTVGFTLELEILSDANDYEGDPFQIYLYNTGESYLNDAELRIYLDGSLATLSKDPRGTLPIDVIELGTLPSDYEEYNLMAYDYSELTYDNGVIVYWGTGFVLDGKTPTTSHTIYAVLTGTTDNGDEYTLQSNTITVYDYTYSSSF